ncbi:hypothetical protein ACVWZV_006068 [Bradyrhizobium sp. GM5.1]
MSTAPVMGTAKCTSFIAGMFGSIAATVSPTPMPLPARYEAKRLQRSCVSRQVKLRPS